MQISAVDAVCFYATIVLDACLPSLVLQRKIVKGAFVQCACNDKWKIGFVFLFNVGEMLDARVAYKQFENTLWLALSQSLQNDWKQKQNENKQKIPTDVSRMWVRAHTVFIALMPSIY